MRRAKKKADAAKKKADEGGDDYLAQVVAAQSWETHVAPDGTGTHWNSYAWHECHNLPSKLRPLSTCQPERCAIGLRRSALLPQHCNGRGHMGSASRVSRKFSLHRFHSARGAHRHWRRCTCIL